MEMNEFFEKETHYWNEHKELYYDLKKFMSSRQAEGARPPPAQARLSEL